MPEAIQNLMPQLVAYGVKIVGVLLAIWISFRVGAWIERLVNNGLRKREFDAALTKFFGSLARWLLITAAILACLGVFGIETTSFAAILGAAGLAIGLAFQGTLSNFAAGVMLLTFRPFRIGDYVKVASNEGTVAEIGLFVTSLDTLDNRRLILPNATIIAANIDNYTHHEVRRVDIDVGVAYSADLDEARRVLDAAAAAVQGRDAKHGHQIFLVGFGDSAVKFQVRVWCDPAIYWDVWDATIVAVKKALDANKVPIPFPQLDLHVKQVPERYGR